MSLAIKKIPREMVEREWWYRGNLRYLLFKHSQTRALTFIDTYKEKNPQLMGPVLMNCHRGWGKSHFLVAYGIQECLRHPNFTVRFGAPTYEQVKDITKPIIKKVLLSCPHEIYPRQSDDALYFRNPRWNDSRAESVFDLFSCKDDADRQRGKRSNLIIIDECREVRNFDYVVRDVLSFHFAKQSDPLMILCSTPPDSPEHPWASDFIPEAHRAGRYYLQDVEHNEDWTEQDDKMLEDICKGKKSTTWEREALCRIVADSSALIIPEYSATLADGTTRRDQIFVKDYTRPKYYIPHVSMDVGFKDFTGIIFAYLDFEAQKLIVVDELLMNYASLKDIATAIRDKEEILFPAKDCIHKRSTRRIADAPEQDIYTMTKDHGLHFAPADKWDQESAVASLRSRIQERKILIHDNCKFLDRQLLNGIYNKTRKDFDRNPRSGHFDLGMALVYLNRMLNWRFNPNLDKQTYADNIFRVPNAKVSTDNSHVTKRAVFVSRTPVCQTHQTPFRP